MDNSISLIADIATILFILFSAGSAIFRFTKTRKDKAIFQWETWVIFLLYLGTVFVVWNYTDVAWVSTAVAISIGVILNLTIDLYSKLVTTKP